MNMNGSNRLDEEIDVRLRGYFRGALPEPWPAPPVQAVATVQAAGNRNFVRLALVASVGVLLAGYLMLASMFPTRGTSRLDSPQNPHIGQRPQIPNLQQK